MATKKPDNKEPAAPRKPQTRSGEIDRVTVDSLSQLQLIKADLEKVSLALVSNEPKLTDPKRQQWEEQLDKVDLAILRARSALLNGLSAAFEEEVPAIEAATGKLADSLAALKKVSAVINAVAGVLGVIEKVITLGR